MNLKKVNCVLLVDDSPSTNFYNKKLIELIGMSDKTIDVCNGEEALEYINHQGKFESLTEFPRPNIILLDINMPKMDGFEFLEEYKKLPKAVKADMLIVFLTTSNWSKDIRKALDEDLIYDFLEKPLELDALENIRDHYFVQSQK